MKTIIFILALLVAAPVAATPEPVGRFAMAVLVIPVALYAIGEFWTAVCEGAGYEYSINAAGDWACSGLPRRPDS